MKHFFFQPLPCLLALALTAGCEPAASPAAVVPIVPTGSLKLKVQSNLRDHDIKVKGTITGAGRTPQEIDFDFHPSTELFLGLIPTLLAELNYEVEVSLVVPGEDLPCTQKVGVEISPHQVTEVVMNLQCNRPPARIECTADTEDPSLLRCPLRIASRSAHSPSAAGLQFDLILPSQHTPLWGFSCPMTPSIDPCAGTFGQSLLQTGHTIANAALSPTVQRVLIYHGGTPERPLTTASLTNPRPSQPSKVADILLRSTAETNAGAVILENIVAFDPDASALHVDFREGVLVTAVP